MAIPPTSIEEDALHDGHYTINARIFTSDVPTMQVGDDAIPLQVQTGYDPFESCTLTGDLDVPTVRGDFRFKLGTGTANLSPYMAAAQAMGRPLLDPGRFILLQVQIRGMTAPLTPESFLPFRSIYLGRIDSVDPASESGIIQVFSRDVMSDLLDKWIEPSPTEGWVIDAHPIEVVIGDLLEIGGAPAFFADQWTTLGADGPQLFIPSYIQQPGPLLPAVRSAALLNGWDLRGRWRWSANQDVEDDLFRLTYYAPDRLLEGDRLTLGPSRYFTVRNFEKSRTNVRNRVIVRPSDPPRAPIFVRDAASEALYGPLFLGVYEDEASRIQTPGQAETLANAILSDLKQPKIMAEFDTRLLPFLEINDVLDVDPNNVHHDTPLTIAISGYTHTLLANGHGTTTLRTRDNPAAANKEWRRGQPKTHYISTEIPSGTARVGATWEQYT